MRRMLKAAACAQCEEGGLLSTAHAVARSGTVTSDVLCSETTPVWTAVIRGKTFFEALRRSAVKQFVSHDRDINSAFVALTLESFIAE